MSRILSSLFLLLAAFSAFAERAAGDAGPAEQASPVTVIVFIVLFVGCCVGFIGYTWWRSRNDKPQATE